MARTLLGELSPDLVEEIIALGRRRRYHARSFIFHEGDPSDTVIVVESGLLRVDRTSPDGRVVLLDLLPAGSVTGELGVLDGEARSATLSSVSEAAVVAIPARAWMDFLRAEPTVHSAVLGQVVWRLRELTDQFLETSTMDAPKRIASRLVHLVQIERSRGHLEPAEDGVIDLRLPISQEELGQWSGLSREGAVRGLSILRNIGLIETGRMRVQIPDLARLEDHALA